MRKRLAIRKMITTRKRIKRIKRITTRKRIMRKRMTERAGMQNKAEDVRGQGR